MNYLYLLIPLFCSVILSIYLLNKIKEIKNLKEKELKNFFTNEWKTQEKELDNQIKLKESELGGKINKLEAILKEKEKRYIEVNQDLDLYKEGKMKEIDGTAAEYEQRKRNLVDQSIDKYRNFQIEHANNKMAVTKEEIDKVNEELIKILEELEVERRKRAAINEEILRQRALDEEQDFYRIQIDPNDKNDVEILRSVAPRLRHPEAINKVIWSAYYQKPLAELRKRVAIEAPGVYKITRIKTGEIYIGQAVNVSTRWADHVKSALGVGTLTSSQLHRVMYEDGPENFTFELLEEVKRDELRERESYYIDFYDSKTYGLNTVSGDKNK